VSLTVGIAFRCGAAIANSLDCDRLRRRSPIFQKDGPGKEDRLAHFGHLLLIAPAAERIVSLSWLRGGPTATSAGRAASARLTPLASLAATAGLTPLASLAALLGPNGNRAQQGEAKAD
jgi:hypothetical protein